MCTPIYHVTKCLWAHNWNLLKILFTLMFIFMIQSSHNFPHVTAAVVTCAKLWPDWIIIFHVRVTQNVAMFNNEFMNESFVKWASGHVWYKYMVQTPMPFIINRDLLGHVPSFPHVWSCDQPDTSQWSQLSPSPRDPPQYSRQLHRRKSHEKTFFGIMDFYVKNLPAL